MTTLAWFGTPNDGATCTVTLGSPIVTVAGSSLITGGGSDPGFVGQAFLGPDGSQYEILSVDLATQLTLRSNYRGTSVVSGGFFQIVPVQGFSRDAAYKLSQLIALITAGSTALQGTKLGAGMVPVNLIDGTQSGSNAPAIASVLNANVGNAATSELDLANGTYTTKLIQYGHSFTTSGVARQDGGRLDAPGLGGLSLGTSANQPIYYYINATEYMRLTAGRLAINNTFTASALSVQGTGTDNVITAYNVGGNYMMAVNGANLGVATGDNAANAMINVRKDSTTNRSINSAGTNNAGGIDYAEYEPKAPDCGDVAKGQIIGFDVNGRLTDKWASVASRFGVKTTNPSYVGGDTWGSDDALGMARPIPPCLDPSAIKSTGAQFFMDQMAAQVQFDADTKAHDAAVAVFATKLEAARQAVDRVGYSGKVPCNVLGASVGDYIVPAQDGLGIKGVPIAVPTFDQYRAAVGRVLNLMPDGRCMIALMVH